MNKQKLLKEIAYLVGEYNSLSSDGNDAMLYSEEFLNDFYALEYSNKVKEIFSDLAAGEIKNYYIRKDGVIVISITNDKREEKIAELFPEEYKKAQSKDNCFVLMISTKE